MSTARPWTLVAAITLLIYTQLRDLLTFVLGGLPGAAEIIPPVVIFLAYVIGLLSIVASYGLWTMRRWAMILTIVLMSIGLLSAAPGLTAAPTRELQVAALIGVVSSLVIIILLLLPASRQAFRSQQTQLA
ncbi:hypothetical protein EYB53_016180 [Candidatus Chloroploca sp. M-50]|uniref:Uncharacterized protein n=1 Tax=Candidatus Chloroploca mongolica TaxID=2528176 RepID=A0ABS4DCT7_9CHLR|nr:hypothetical protein [Candidatus Chloroploca mongolica]MBP1467252.1 hypothetical protein [Candidatus Chloroploca mongolica]